MSGFRGEDGSIVDVNAVPLPDALFSYGRLVRLTLFLARRFMSP
jgi:hypothetical protein